MHRLFVAVWPPPDVVELLSALRRPDEPGVRWVPPENLHVTLRFVGNADIDAVTDRLGAAVLPAATATLGPVVSRYGRDVIGVPVEGLDDLAAAVCDATRDLGRPVDPRSFSGHLTIARLRARAACGVAGTRVRARFDVHDVALVASTTAHDGARYQTLATWPTADAAEH